MNNLVYGDYCLCKTFKERIEVIEKLRSLDIRIGEYTWDTHQRSQDFLYFPILKYTVGRFIVSVPTGGIELRNEYSVEEFLDKASGIKKPKDRYKVHNIRHHFI